MVIDMEDNLIIAVNALVRATTIVDRAASNLCVCLEVTLRSIMDDYHKHYQIIMITIMIIFLTIMIIIMVTIMIIFLIIMIIIMIIFLTIMVTISIIFLIIFLITLITILIIMMLTA